MSAIRIFWFIRSSFSQLGRIWLPAILNLQRFFCRCGIRSLSYVFLAFTASCFGRFFP